MQREFAQAAANAKLANEAFVRTDRLMMDWLTLADPRTGLLPRNTTADGTSGTRRTAPRTCIPSSCSPRGTRGRICHGGRMQEMLLTETALTARIGRLPDTYSFSKQGFAEARIDTAAIMFGGSEYVKDGLMPITELLGVTPWRARMLGIVDDLWRYAPVETPLRTNRVAGSRGERRHAARAVAPLLDDARRSAISSTRRGSATTICSSIRIIRRATSRTLRLRDHGNEVVSGLTELYATLLKVQPAKAAAYRAPIHEMLDRILAVGRNEDGLFYNVDRSAGGEAGRMPASPTTSATC